MADQLQIAIITPGAAELAGQLASEAPSPIQYPSEKPPEVLAEDREIVGYRIGIPRERMRIVPVAEIFGR